MKVGHSGASWGKGVELAESMTRIQVFRGGRFLLVLNFIQERPPNSS
jgi:hypothetical protein